MVYFIPTTEKTSAEGLARLFRDNTWKLHRLPLSQLCYGPVVIYCMVYYYTKRAMLARLLANKGLAIYVVYLNRYYVIPLWHYLVVTFLWQPQSIISDKGPQFMVEIMWKLNRMLGIESKLSMAFHPQIDRQTERVNQELEQYLRIFINHRQEQWPKWLGTAEFAYNNKVHLSTWTIFFKANYK